MPRLVGYFYNLFALSWKSLEQFGLESGASSGAEVRG